MRRIMLALTLLIAALAAAPAAAAPLAPAFTFAGKDCVEPTAVAEVPAARVTPYLPAGYVPTEALGLPGLTDVIFSVSKCEQSWVNGEPVADGLQAVAGVSVESPDGSAGAHYYELWETTSMPALAAQMRQLGVRGGLVSGLSYRPNVLGPLEQARVAVPWSELPYSFDVHAAAPVAIAGSLNTWWHDTPQGHVRIAYTLTNLSDVDGAATISARAGSELAKLTGSATAVGVGLISRFAFTTTVSAPPLTVVVSPPVVRAGRQTSLQVRVSHLVAVGDQPVGSATVDICGQRVSTNADGVAVVSCRFADAATAAVRAVARGYVGAVSTIKVLRPARRHHAIRRGSGRR